MAKVSKEPLQPSADASKLDLSGDLPFTSKKAKTKPKSQKQQIAEVVKKSIALHKQGQKKDQKTLDAAEALFKFKQEHIQSVQSLNYKDDKVSVNKEKTEKAKEKVKEAKPVTQVDEKKSKKEKKEKKLAQKNKMKTKKTTGSAATADERDHEILQLDNLFLTVRE